MASFTDKPMQFNPYIQQLPVEEMVKVGMIKQDQYDKGVQKIQGQIDQVAGLDIYKDVDKAYLQSKLNQLGGNLTTVAAGDFSNFQLVNSVGGMVKQIGNDKIVQTAVASTAKGKKEFAFMEEERKKGKLTPDNEYVFKKKFSSWADDEKVGQSFDDRYDPHFDVFKFAKETFDAVLPDNMTWDEVFAMGKDGKPLADKKGNLTYSPAMTRMEKEGRFPKKVKETLEQIFSDPRVGKQLAITGEYDYRNYDEKALSDRVMSQRSEVLASLDDNLLDLQLKKNLGKDVQAEIDNITLAKNNVNSRYDQYAKLVIDNPDVLRGQLYKDDVTSRYTTMFGQTRTKQTVMDNPYWNATFKLQQEANRVKEAQDAKKLGYLNYQLSKDNAAFDKTMKIKQYQLDLFKAGKGDGASTTRNAKQTAQKSDYDILTSYDDEYTNVAGQYNSSVDAILFSTLLNTDNNKKILENLTKNGKMSKEEAYSSVINDFAKDNGESPDVFRTRWIDKVMKDKNALSTTNLEKRPDLKLMFDNYTNVKQRFNYLNGVKQQIDKSVPKDVNINLSDVKPIEVDLKYGKMGGVKTVITKEDFYDLALSLQLREASYEFTVDESTRQRALAAEKRLKDRGKEELIDAALAEKGTSVWNPAKSLIRMATPGSYYDALMVTGKRQNFLNELNKVYERVSDKSFSDALNTKTAILKSKWQVSPNLASDVLTGDTKVDKAILGNIANTVGRYVTMKQNYSGDFNSEKILGILNSKDDAKGIELQTTRNDATGEITSEYIFYGTNGKRVAGMTVTNEESTSIGVNPQSLYETQNVRSARIAIENSSNNATSVEDPTKLSTYMSNDVAFNKENFINLQSLNADIKANVIQVEGKYFPIIYINDHDRKPVIRVLPGDTDLGKTMQRIEKLDITTATDILNNK